jgi:hypothetical protein
MSISVLNSQGVAQTISTLDDLIALLRAEDSAHVSGHPGFPMLGVRKDSLASLVGSDGDYANPLFDANGAQWVQLASLGPKQRAASLSVTSATEDYEYVGASQTNQPLGATGAQGDVLSGLLIIPASVSPGAVSVTDGSAGTARTLFAGGTNSVSNLVPFFVPMGAGALSLASGGWRVTTGANVAVYAFGEFT